jgi:ectoine hydroxylase-related dioxygenase (phytanoyl-CoA dioxygenase family)
MLSDGYRIEAQCLSKQKCDEIIAELASVRRSRAGARHLMTHPMIAEVAECPTFIDIAASWLGGNAVPFRATLFDKSAQQNWLIPWHQDTALPLVRKTVQEGWGSWSEKEGVIYAHAPTWALRRIVALRLQLDDSNSDNGPLRVIPGSHEQGVLADPDVQQYASNHSSVDCLTDRGGLIIMRPLLIHSSPKAATLARRRVLHIEYCDTLDFGNDVRLAVV